VPTVLVFRSVTPLMTAILESAFLHERFALASWLAMAVILGGAVCYVVASESGPDGGHGDDASIKGYLWLSVNLAAAAAYHVYVKGVINHLAPSPTDMVLWNNTLSIPPLVLLAAALDRVGELPRAFGQLDTLGWLWVTASMLVASAIAFTGFGMQSALSATSATVVNHINKVAAFVVAFLVFKA
jgi:drug/metabolite transporter (DMT)-like permease